MMTLLTFSGIRREIDSCEQPKMQRPLVHQSMFNNLQQYGSTPDSSKRGRYWLSAFGSWPELLARQRCLPEPHFLS